METKAKPKKKRLTRAQYADLLDVFHLAYQESMTLHVEFINKSVELSPTRPIVDSAKEATKTCQCISNNVAHMLHLILDGDDQ